MNLSFNPDFLLFSSELLWKLFKLKSDLFMGWLSSAVLALSPHSKKVGQMGLFCLEFTGLPEPLLALFK